MITGAILRKFRKKKGLTIKEFAKILGISSNKAYKIERNLISLEPKHFKYLKEHFGTDEFEIMFIYLNDLLDEAIKMS
jgi:transcriptional regulator with XRE-family HTH domain